MHHNGQNHERNSPFYHQLQETLLRCDPFESKRALRAIFTDNRIELWANQLPEADTPKARVEAVIDWLNGKTHHDLGENGLLLLLQVLRDRTHPNDQLHVDLSELIEQLTPPPPADATPPPPVENPYRGLRNFTQAQADYFYGRAAATQTLLQRVGEIAADDQQAKLLAMLGPSGSGKSSLVLAGLLPALAHGELAEFPTWIVRVTTPGREPLASLVYHLVEGNQAKASRLQKRLAERGLTAIQDWLDDALDFLSDDEQARFLLVIDQFEEIFTLCEDEAELNFFLDVLQTISHRPNRFLIILTMRADFYGKALLHEPLTEAMAGHISVHPMSVAELRQAIVEPATKAGLTLEAGLVETLIDESRQGAATLPLVQQALSELFEQRADRQLTQAAYHAIRGIRGAIAHRAEKTLQGLEPSQRKTAQHILLELVQLGEGVEDTSRRVDVAQFPDRGEAAFQQVVYQLANAHLIVTSRDSQSDQETLEVAHEALIREWDTLRTWLDDNRDRLRLQRRVEADASEWRQHKREASYLYSGARLATLRDDLQLNRLGQQFARASRQAETIRLAEKERRQRNLRRLAYTLGVIAALALIAMMVAFYFQNQASQNAATAQAERDKANNEAAINKIQALVAPSPASGRKPKQR